LDERFTLLEPGFCLTVHKSQGSTYREVFIDQKDIDKAPKADDRWRLSYVATTRASERAVFLIN
jgi:exodeoxyribonuclease-5